MEIETFWFLEFRPDFWFSQHFCPYKTKETYLTGGMETILKQNLLKKHIVWSNSIQIMLISIQI